MISSPSRRRRSPRAAPGRCPGPRRRGPARAPARADDDAAVVDGDEAQQLDLAGLREDFDHRDVGAEGEGLVVGSEEVGRFQPGAEFGGQRRRNRLFRRCPPDVKPRSGTPVTRNVPSTTSMSSTAASSRCAAIAFALSRILSSAMTTAPPPTASPRLPMVPLPCGVFSGVAVVDADASQSALPARRPRSGRRWSPAPGHAARCRCRSSHRRLVSTRTVALSNGPKPQIST